MDRIEELGRGAAEIAMRAAAQKIRNQGYTGLDLDAVVVEIRQLFRDRLDTMLADARQAFEIGMVTVGSTGFRLDAAKIGCDAVFNVSLRAAQDAATRALAVDLKCEDEEA